MLRARVIVGAAAIAITITGLPGCDGGQVQSILHPQGSSAGQIAELWWILFMGGGVGYLLVISLMVWGLFRRRTGGERPRPVSVALWIGVGGVAVPTLILSAFLFFTLQTLGGYAGAIAEADGPTIRVIGHRWWWEIEYADPQPDRRLITANEIHIPAGRTVRVELESRDIIHSFWVPELQGKTDMIPGHVNVTTLHADAPGVYRGQCAEYCGRQHANMAILVVAMEEDAFEAWYEHQLTEAVAPSDPLTQAGQRVFFDKPCALCHAIRGTLALGRAGPDLTHLASRRTLAAGALPNTRGHLGGWITAPQSLKPGALMPDTDLDAEELLALLAYLESLE